MTGEKKMSLADLPADILVNILPYLDVRSFLSLCSTSTGFYRHRLDPAYWRRLVRTTFRLPDQPLLHTDGARWQKLYRRLCTQSHVFTWGQASSEFVLNFRDTFRESMRANPHARRFVKRFVHWPSEVRDAMQIGTVVDIQCGGWSVTMLNSEGALYTLGNISGSFNTLHAHNRSKGILELLQFPSGYPQIDERYDPAIAIAQFSSGRSHVLGLSDSGRIWFWHKQLTPALNIEFLHVDTVKYGGASGVDDDARGTVQRVVAGWDRSSAYVKGTGIVVWDTDPYEQQEEDTLLVDADTVPQSGYLRPRGNTREPDDATEILGSTVGEVIKHIILEGYTVFLTDLGKVFAAKTETREKLLLGVVELSGFVDQSCPDAVDRNNTNDKVSDIQGSFRSFAAFKMNGGILLGDRRLLDAYWDSKFGDGTTTELPEPRSPHALQNKGIISLAFGDYHYHALHANGQISSYGNEPQSSGALGLGEYSEGGSFRGLNKVGHVQDINFLPHATSDGRRVWFEPTKREWLRFMSKGGSHPDEAHGRLQLVNTRNDVRDDLGEWFEQEGAHWNDHSEVSKLDDDGLGPYYALTIAAGGWHSTALVLVNEKMAAKSWEVYAQPVNPEASFSMREWARKKWNTFSSTDLDTGPRQLRTRSSMEQLDRTGPATFKDSDGQEFRFAWADDPFPRIQLRSGEEMPGQVPLSDWKDGKPY
ncbi:hypothetical protein L228DRAFT_243509 [Xylona heveae TC161]|uniref:F-box domain-containing protein n=1 Tax=Xylona heveae (strain CBS 132557 / TC161) TaxID=1328760 RepID=A0A165K3W7_XYLHT|nr:hypothetical protein L228DRAFT_243509 [Xylona heveae TC161]KZF26955.1 hypothetical protein L228DRAFT_243509 [Xylona heveae TC161]